jgi:iron complex outermembrane recepter protein
MSNVRWIPGLRARVLPPVLGLLSVAPLAPPAWADADDTRTMGEIIVTATRREESLQDVPIAVSAITAEDIRARGFAQYADYLNSVPGVYYQEAGPGSSSIVIRGASESGGGTTVASYFGEAVTSVLVNGGGKPNLRLVDIDRIEVLRGPQGTIFGADALAGVVRTIPAAPDLESFGIDVGMRGFTTAHSDDESYHAEGAINIPLVKDRLALRLVGYKDDIAGYIDNVVPAQDPIDYSVLLDLLLGQDPGTTPEGTLVVPGNAAFSRGDINSEDTWGARAALTWQATDHLRFELMYAKQDVELDSEPRTDPAVGDYEQSRSLDVFEEGSYGEQMDLGTLVISYDWDRAALTSASSWAEMDRFLNRDITFLATGAFGVPIPWALHDTSLGKLFTQELRLQSRGEGALQWTIGAFYMEEETDLSQFVPDYSCPTCLPLVAFGQDFAFDVPLQTFSEEEQRSLFAEASYAFTPQWTVGAGVRYLEADITDIAPAADGLINGGANPQGEPNEGTVDETNPSAYIRYDPTEGMMLYLQAGRGFRSGVVNGALPDECADQAAAAGLGSVTGPDTLWNYEVGFKSQLAGGRLGLNAAVYVQDWKDVQLALGLDCGFSGVVNGGDAGGEGVEVELVAQPNDAWRFNLSASYNKLEFDSVQAGTGFETGERLPDSPEKNASAGVQFNFGLGEAWDGFARADYAYVSDVAIDFPTGDVIQDAFDTVNLRLGFHREQLAVELFGRNVADERGVIATDNPAFGGGQILIRPREYGVELRYSFE